MITESHFTRIPVVSWRCVVNIQYPTGLNVSEPQEIDVSASSEVRAWADCASANEGPSVNHAYPDDGILGVVRVVHQEATDCPLIRLVVHPVYSEVSSSSLFVFCYKTIP